MGAQANGEPTACSFCIRKQSDRVHLLTANGLSICNYCVAFAHHVFSAEGKVPRELEDPGFADGGLEDTLTRPRIPR
jgi:ATP-dependent protease Clp ATPase subunit